MLEARPLSNPHPHPHPHPNPHPNPHPHPHPNQEQSISLKRQLSLPRQKRKKSVEGGDKQRAERGYETDAEEDDLAVSGKPLRMVRVPAHVIDGGLGREAAAEGAAGTKVGYEPEP